MNIYDKPHAIIIFQIQTGTNGIEVQNFRQTHASDEFLVSASRLPAELVNEQ